MKTIKRFLPVLVLTLAIHGTTAAQTTFGLRGGINFQNLNGRTGDDDKVMGKLRTAFHLGANAEIIVGEGFYLQPGVLFSLKGSNAKAGELATDIHLSYIEIPVNFIYKPDLGEGRLLLGFGPYLGIAVGGKFKAGGLEEDIEFGSDPDQFRRIDAGGNLLAGYEFANNFSFQLNAQLGLGNLVNRESGDNNSKLNNTGFGVSVGYRFGR